MSNKIFVCTSLQNPTINHELHRFKQAIEDQNGENEFIFTKCTPEDTFDYLQTGKASVVLIPLHKIPVNIPDGITIGALSERKDIREAIFINKEAYDEQLDYRIRKGASIAIQNERQRYQIAAVRGDLHFVDNKIQADAYFANDNDEIPVDTKVVRLNPKEFLPEPGYGVYAWLTPVENIEMRTLLKNLHNKDTAVLTNIERKVLKINSDPNLSILGVHAYGSHDGHIHLFANALYKGNYSSRRLSQSTTVSISENMIEELKSVPVNH